MSTKNGFGRQQASDGDYLVERRGVESTIFGTVLDLSGAAVGYVRRVNQEGDLKRGFALLKIETTDGVDYCFASYRPGEYNQSGLETDALQALVQSQEAEVQSLYLGGGLFLKFGGASIKRSGKGLADLEKASDGGYIVSNPSPDPATLTVRLPALNGFEVFKLDDRGRPAGKADVTIRPEARCRSLSTPRAELRLFRRQDSANKRFDSYDLLGRV